MKQNRKAKFWIRFLIKTIDIILISSILVVLLIPNINLSRTIEFNHPWNFYVWSVLAIAILFIYFYLLPVITNGSTIGNYITRTKIKYSKNRFIEQAKREAMFSFIYIINIIFMMLLINHTLIGYLVSKKIEEKTILDDFEKVRVSLYITITSFGILISAIGGISIIIKNGIGLNDIISKSQAIYINKYNYIKVNKNKLLKIKPKPVKYYIIEWIEQEHHE